jgi:Leu/Phe-tRNA-protein transferase
MNKIHFGIENLKRDRNLFWEGHSFEEVSDLKAGQFASLYACGKYPLETEEGFDVFTTKYREIIPIEFRIPHGFKKIFLSDKFRFSVDQRFSQAVDECLKPRILRPGEKAGHQWMDGARGASCMNCMRMASPIRLKPIVVSAWPGF